MARHRLVIFVIFLLATSAACDGLVRISAGDGNPIDGNLCSPPCWQMIQPGITLESEVFDLLMDNSLIQTESIERIGTIQNGNYHWTWRSGYLFSPGVVHWLDGVVSEIILGVSSSVTVEEVIDKYGYPEVVSRLLSGTPERQTWLLTLFYPRAGMQLTIYLDQDGMFEPSDDLIHWTFFVPSSLDEYLNFLSARDTTYQPLVTIDDLMPWNGFGDINDLYPNFGE